jgi:hypothetical protein
MNIKNLAKLALVMILACVPMMMSLPTPASALVIYDPAEYVQSGMVNGPLYQDSQGQIYGEPGPGLTATYGPF